MKTFACLFSIIVISSANLTLLRLQDDLKHFKEWSKSFLKDYKTKEHESLALKSFISDKKKVEFHNERFKNGKETFKCGLWKNSDLSLSEKQTFLTGYKAMPENIRKRRDLTVIPQFPHGPLSINWTAKGLVGHVGDQGFCKLQFLNLNGK